MKNGHRLQAVNRWLVRASHIAVSEGQPERSGFRIVQIEKGNISQFEQGLEVEIYAGSHLCLSRITAFSRLLRLKNKPNIGVQFEVGNDLWQELCCRCLCARRRLRSATCLERNTSLRSFQNRESARSRVLYREPPSAVPVWRWLRLRLGRQSVRTAGHLRRLLGV
jgi:hypothetical protein